MRQVIPIDELIQVEIASIKRILQLDKDVIYITNVRVWKKMFRRDRPENHAGLSQKHYGYIFINLKENHTYKDLKDTLYHELIHLKFPKATEKQVINMCKRYID